MADRAGTPGSIFDLGYQRYSGVRLGRPHAVWTLFLYTMRGIFGLGRSTMAKVFPIGLAIVASVPALVQVAIAALVPADFEVITAEDYFGFVAIVLVLFCAVVSPEIIGRDQRHQTLPLYFSRSLSRADYVTGKVTALMTALFAVLVVPQIVLIIGNGVASDDLLASFETDADQLPAVLLSSLLIAGFMAGMSVAIASQSPRRAISTGAVLAYFVIFAALGGIMVDTTDGDSEKLLVLLSPFDTLEGAVLWIFNEAPEGGSTVEDAGLAGGWHTLAALAYIGGSLAYLYRRYLRISV